MCIIMDVKQNLRDQIHFLFSFFYFQKKKKKRKYLSYVTDLRKNCDDHTVDATSPALLKAKYWLKDNHTLLYKLSFSQKGLWH